LPQEKEMAERWEKLPPVSRTGYEAKLAYEWRQIGCSAANAPYVLEGLIETMSSHHSPFLRNSIQVPELSADFLKDDCAGAIGLSDDAKRKLSILIHRTGAK